MILKKKLFLRSAWFSKQLTSFWLPADIYRISSTHGSPIDFPSLGQVAMPRKRAGSWAVHASLGARQPWHDWFNSPLRFLNHECACQNRVSQVYALTFYCSIFEWFWKAATIVLWGHDIKSCGPSSTCSSSEGLGLRNCWAVWFWNMNMTPKLHTAQALIALVGFLGEG